MQHLAEPIFLQIGRVRYQVESIDQASEMFCRARDESDLGSRETPDGRVVTADGKPVARISYNGRVWPPEKWTPGMKPLLEACR